MRRLVWLITVLVVVGIGITFLGSLAEAPVQNDSTSQQSHNMPESQQHTNFSIATSAFTDGGYIPMKYTCDGENISPPITITNTNDAIDSLVLIMDDPDAVKPAGKVWDHWVIFNLKPTITNLKEGMEPEGVLGVNSGERLGYQGPCPPDGEHRYFFKLYGITGRLNLSEGATKAEVEEAIEGNIVEQAQLMGRYTRK